MERADYVAALLRERAMNEANGRPVDEIDAELARMDAAAPAARAVHATSTQAARARKRTA